MASEETAAILCDEGFSGKTCFLVSQGWVKEMRSSAGPDDILHSIQDVEGAISKFDSQRATPLFCPPPSILGHFAAKFPSGVTPTAHIISRQLRISPKSRLPRIPLPPLRPPFPDLSFPDCPD